MMYVYMYVMSVCMRVVMCVCNVCIDVMYATHTWHCLVLSARMQAQMEGRTDQVHEAQAVVMKTERERERERDLD